MFSPTERSVPVSSPGTVSGVAILETVESSTRGGGGGGGLEAPTPWISPAKAAVDIERASAKAMTEHRSVFICFSDPFLGKRTGVMRFAECVEPVHHSTISRWTD